MENEKTKAYLTRDGILKLLSDAEVTSVSTAETANVLPNGDEYLDLQHLESGVRKAEGTTVPMTRVLPRNSIHKDTWNKILGLLARHDRAS